MIQKRAEEATSGEQAKSQAFGQTAQQAQTQLYTTVQGMVANGTLTPDMYKKVKKPFADTLYVLGVKDCDAYLPTDDEVVAMIKQGQQAQQMQMAKDQAAKELIVFEYQQKLAFEQGLTQEIIKRNAAQSQFRQEQTVTRSDLKKGEATHKALVDTVYPKD